MRELQELPRAPSSGTGRSFLTSAERDEAGRRLRERANRRRTFKEGALVQRRGDPVDGLHVIDSGVLSFTRENGGGADALLHVGLPGFWYGITELRSLGGRAKPVTARANGETVITSVPERAIEELLSTDELVRRFFLSTMVGRYESMLDVAEAALKTSPPARLATRLLAFARVNALPGQLPVTMEIPVSQATLSALAGVSRQTANKALKQLASGGAVQLLYGGIRIVDFEALAAFACAPSPVVESALADCGK